MIWNNLSIFILAAILALPGNRAVSGTAAELFAKYQRKDFDGVAAELATLRDFEAFGLEVDKVAAGWKLEPKAAFLLEASAAAYKVQLLPAARSGPVRRSQWPALKMLEAACGALRAGRPNPEFDRRWQLAAVALLEAISHPVTGPNATGPNVIEVRGPLQRHLDHVKTRLDDGTVLLAEALVSEQMAWVRWNYELPALRGNSVPGAAAAHGRLVGSWERDVDRAIGLLHQARKYPNVRVEATIRLGTMLVMRGRSELGLQMYLEARDLTRDPWWLFLSNLLEGRVHEAARRLEEGEVAYRAALAQRPHAQSALVAVASLSFLRGDPTGAAHLAQTAMGPADDDEDPWILLPYGDSRRWHELVLAMREALR
jgi:hypothetical protein